MCSFKALSCSVGVSSDEICSSLEKAIGAVDTIDKTFYAFFQSINSALDARIALYQFFMSFPILRHLDLKGFFLIKSTSITADTVLKCKNNSLIWRSQQDKFLHLFLNFSLSDSLQCRCFFNYFVCFPLRLRFRSAFNCNFSVKNFSSDNILYGIGT